MTDPTPDFDDRLVDQMLREMLARDTVPDVLRRVRARHSASQSQRRMRLFAGMSVAASVLLLIGAWAAWPKPYPSPSVRGDVAVVDGGPVGRGAEVETKETPVQLTLGGYVNVTIDPKSVVKIEGAPEQERISLYSGTVHCKVTKLHGSFEVATLAGVVKVTGTQFSATASTAINEQGFRTRGMLVTVSEGSVRVTGPWGDRDVAAGQHMDFTTTELTPATQQGKKVIRGILKMQPEGLVVEESGGGQTMVLARGAIPANYAPALGSPYIVVWEDGRVISITSLNGEPK